MSTMTSRWLTWPVLIAAGLAVAWIGVMLVRYGMVDGYVDHMEANVAIPSWLWLSGRPIYPPADKPIEFLTTYGPLVYLINGGTLAVLGGSIATSKVAGLVAGGLALAIFIAAEFLGRDRLAAGTGVLMFAGFLLIKAPAVFWNRPDSFLLLLTTLGLLAMVQAERGRNRTGPALLVGVLIGLAVNLKVHGFAYFLPAIVWFAARENSIGAAFVLLVKMGLVSLVAFALPFAVPGISITDYVSEMTRLIPEVTHSMPVFLLILRYTPLYLIAPLLMLGLAAVGRIERERAELAYAGAFVVCYLLLLYPATTPGAGTNHFIPLFPFAADLAAGLIARANRRWLQGVVAVLALLTVALGIPNQRHLARDFREIEARGAARELRAIVTENFGKRIEMGYGARIESYPDTFVRPVLVFAGHPFSLEAMTMMELINLGQTPPDTFVKHLGSCSTDIWVTPKGEEPFVMGSYYGGRMVGDSLRAAFLSAYEKTGSRKYYDLWTCRGR
jgi:hypothetical protein